MKRILFLAAIVFLFFASGCGKDEVLSIRELLTIPDSWEMTSISEDPNNEYTEVVALSITFYDDGDYEYYIAFDGGSWEDGSGEWLLSGNQLELVDDDVVFTIEQITKQIARLKDNDAEAVLNFEADN